MDYSDSIYTWRANNLHTGALLGGLVALADRSWLRICDPLALLGSSHCKRIATEARSSYAV